MVGPLSFLSFMLASLDFGDILVVVFVAGLLVEFAACHPLPSDSFCCIGCEFGPILVLPSDRWLGSSSGGFAFGSYGVSRSSSDGVGGGAIVLLSLAQCSACVILLDVSILMFDGPASVLIGLGKFELCRVFVIALAAL